MFVKVIMRTVWIDDLLISVVAEVMVSHSLVFLCFFLWQVHTSTRMVDLRQRCFVVEALITRI